VSHITPVKAHFAKNTHAGKHDARRRKKHELTMPVTNYIPGTSDNNNVVSQWYFAAVIVCDNTLNLNYANVLYTAAVVAGRGGGLTIVGVVSTMEKRDI
jgi:hypothetical protein